MHFFDHGFKECPQTSIQDRCNPLEAEMVLRCAKYLLRMGHAPAKIAVLTMHKGQLIKLKAMIKEQFPKLKQIYLSTVENFQGDQIEIVLLSLMRSDVNDLRGFFIESRLMSVALSRASQGKLTRTLHFRAQSVS